MLDLDLDLEADLGVDTVKQAEVFAAIRETYNIPRDDELEAARFPDAGACDPVRVRPPARPEGRCASRPCPSHTAPAAHTEDAVRHGTHPGSDGREDRLSARHAGPGPRPGSRLGVDTVKQAEMFAAIRETYNIPRDANLKLRDYPTLAHVIRFVYDQPARSKATASVPAPPARPRRRPLPPRTDDDSIERKCWRSSPRRPATPRTCWTWTSTWKPTSASTPSSRRRCSPPCAPPTTSRAIRRISSCAIFRPSRTSFNSRATAADGYRCRRAAPRAWAGGRSRAAMLATFEAADTVPAAFQFRCCARRSTCASPPA